MWLIGYSLGSVTIDQVAFIQTVPVSVLVEVSAGRVNLNRLAREELANRGYDSQGVWVGFREAASLFEGEVGYEVYRAKTHHSPGL